MNKIALISCCKNKKNIRCKVKNLYISKSFISNMALVEKMSLSDRYVLSAKHGLLEMDQEIEPYDVVLTSFDQEYIKNWAISIAERLSHKEDLNKTKFYIFANEDYYQPLIEYLPYHEIVPHS